MSNKYIKQAKDMIESLTQTTRNEKRKNKYAIKNKEDSSIKERAKQNVLKW